MGSFEILILSIIVLTVVYVCLAVKYRHTSSAFSLRRTLCVLAVLYIAAPAAYFGIYWVALQDKNQLPLNIETFDGLNSPYHPSVLYFPDSWNGYKYWMAETPYSPKCQPYRDRNECPSIHVSQDGVNWLVPDGLTNPIVNFGVEGERNLDYYCDNCLILNRGGAIGVLVFA